MANVLPPAWAIETAQKLDELARRTLEDAVGHPHTVANVLGDTVDELASAITRSCRAWSLMVDEAKAQRLARDGATQTLVARLRFVSGLVGAVDGCPIGDAYETGSMHVVSVGSEGVLTSAFLCAMATNRIAKARREYEEGP